MDAKPAVVYSVTSTHMVELSYIADKGKLKVGRGEARLLEAICPAVWPDMRLRVTEETAYNDYNEPTVTVLRLRLMTAQVTLTPGEGYLERIHHRRERLKEQGRYGAFCQTQEPSDAILMEPACVRKELWAASREEAEAVWRAEAQKQLCTIEIDWGSSRP